MGLVSGSGDSESRFAADVEALAAALGHADRAAPFQSYCAGLLLPGERKSVEPMAARVEPQRVQAAHQSLHHLVAKADWSDDAVLAAVRTHAAGVGLRFVVDLEAGKTTAQIGKALQVLSALGCSIDITPPPQPNEKRKP